MPLFTYFTIPASTTADLLAFANGLVTDFWQLILLALALPASFWVISKIIGMFHFRTTRRT